MREREKEREGERGRERYKPLKKYHLLSQGEKAAASMVRGRWSQRCWRGRGALAFPSGYTFQNRLPRNMNNVPLWSEVTHPDTRHQTLTAVFTMLTSIHAMRMNNFYN